MTIMSAFAVLMLLTALNCFPIFTLALHSRLSRANGGMPKARCASRAAGSANGGNAACR
jgi:thiol:disulfide interchange protein